MQKCYGKEKVQTTNSETSEALKSVDGKKILRSVMTVRVQVPPGVLKLEGPSFTRRPFFLTTNDKRQETNDLGFAEI